MKLDRFINRPVLSTVISILIVILGAIGLATLPITQYPDIAPSSAVPKDEICVAVNCRTGRIIERVQNSNQSSQLS